MSETTKPRVTTTFGEVLAPIQPEAARLPLVEKLDEALNVILTNNRRVARVQESKNTDPNNVEYQDSTWRRIAEEQSDPEIVAAEARYQELNAEIEELLSTLREKSKAFMQPALSEEEIQKERKLINEGKATIDSLKLSAGALADFADAMLTASGNGIEGGVWSLMPNVESLLNTRGRKSAGKSAAGGGYATRIGTILVDGVDVGKGEGADRKYNWPIVAEYLSKRFNGDRFEGNKVSALELEEALYNALGVEWRDKSSLKDIDFEFKKDIEVQNTNDDGTKTEPHTVKISFAKWAAPEKTEENVTPTNEGDTPAANDAPTNEGSDASANEGETEKPSRRRK